MKLVAVLMGALLALPAIANADTLYPPSGPVVVEDDLGTELLEAEQPAPPQQPARPGMPRWQPGPGGPQQAGPQHAGPRAAQRRALRQALMQQFDVNGDGRLGPRERMRAIRMLRRLERQLAAPMRQGQGQIAPRPRRVPVPVPVPIPDDMP